VSSTGLAAGDVIQLRNGGASLGTAYTVLAADVTAGKATINVLKSALGADGAKTLTATVTDLAGNVGTTAASLAVTVDTTVISPVTVGTKLLSSVFPTATSKTLLSAGDVSTWFADLESYTFTLGGGASGPARAIPARAFLIDRSVSGQVTAWVGGFEGGYTKAVRVIFRNIEGGGVSVTSNLAKFIDRDVTDGSVNLNTSGQTMDIATSDSVHGYALKNITFPPRVISGTGEAGAEVELYDVDDYTTFLGIATVQANGVWDLSLSPGTYQLSARQTDLAGNVSQWSDMRSLTVSPLPAPVLSVKSEQDKFINGLESSVDIEIVYEGVAVGDKIQLVNGSSNVGSLYTVSAADVTNGKVSLNLLKSSLGADGSKQIYAVVTAASGLRGVNTEGFTLLLDTVAGVPTSGTKLTTNIFANAVTKNLFSDGDVTTHFSDLESYKFTLGGGSSGSARSIAAQAFRIDRSVSGQVSAWIGGFDDGWTKAVKVVFRNIEGGGVSVTSTLAKYTGGDVTDGSFNFDTSGSPMGVATTDGTPGYSLKNMTYPPRVISGSAEIGSTVEIFNDGALVATVVTDSSGTWTYSLPVGNYKLSVKQTDLAGNVSLLSTPYDLVVNPTPVPVLTIVSGQDAYINASENSVGLNVSYVGLAAGDSIQMKLGASNLGSVYTVTSADVTAGKATINVLKSALGADGAKALLATVKSISGLSGSSATSLGLTLDTIAAAPTVGVKQLQNIFPVSAAKTFMPSGNVATWLADLENFDAIIGGGSSGGNALVSKIILVNRTVPGQVSAWVAGYDSAANLTKAVNVIFRDMANGGIEITSTLAKYTDGNATTGAFNFNTSGQLQVVASSAGVNGYALKDLKFSSKVISGIGEVGANIEIFDNGVSLGSTTVGPDGVWNYQLTPGAHSITVKQTDLAGNASQLSAAYTTTVTPVALDLNGDGEISYHQTSIDIDGDGVLDQTTWVDSQDGVLVWDRYQDGIIHDKSQYAFSLYSNSVNATDLSGLAAVFDENRDNLFDKNDSLFNQFFVWQDINADGISQPGELHTMSSLGIVSIDLKSNNVITQPAVGVTSHGETTAKLANGHEILVVDAEFSYIPGVENSALMLDDFAINSGRIL